MPPIQWLEWNDEAFEKAKAEDRPVLLVVRAAWCRWCKALDQETFSDDEVTRLVGESFIPIQVDKDKRPDIDTRYNMGGWPSIAFLTPEADLITGGTYFSPREMSQLLERIAAAYKEDRNRIEESIREMLEKEEAESNAPPARGGQLNLKIITNVSRSIYREFDEKYGGFGTGQKFPHSEALDFAIVQYFKTNDLKLFGVINKNLQVLAEGGLFDEVDGGFFRYCATRDWRSPHTEKLLETNVNLLCNYLDAARVMKRDAYRKVAKQTCSYICSELWDEDKKAFWGSQDADDDYYELNALDRKDRKSPQADRTIYASLNAQAASAFLKAGAVLDEPGLQEMALSALEFVLQNMYTPERGVYHYYDNSRHILGLLADQIYLCDALLQAVEYRGVNRYLDIIRDLIETIIKKQSSDLGGFYDIPQDRLARGGLRRQNKSILENAAMASVLIRYHYITLEKNYLDLAERTLKAFAKDYHLYGYFTASYARAVDLFFYKPIYVVIMGKQDSEKTELLRKTATQIYLPSCIALTVDPETEPELVERMQFPIGREPKAYLCLEQSCRAAVDDPESLQQAILELEAERAPPDLTRPTIEVDPLAIKPRVLLSAPDNRPWAIGRYLKDALDQLEVPVRLFDFREADDLGADLLNEIEAFKPDLHLIFKGELFDRELIESVRAAGVPSVLWHHDVDPDMPAWLMEVAGASDFYFTHARGMVDRYRRAGIPHVDWLSEGFPERFIYYEDIDTAAFTRYACQVTLVGNIHMNERYRLRAAMIARAIQDGYSVKWWGPRISRKLRNLGLIFSRAGRAYGGGMVANAEFAKAVTCADIFLARDVYPEVDGSVSNRLYWACGSGAFYLSHNSVGIEDIMTPGREIETYSTLDEMSEKIAYYLEHPGERRKIARAGQARVLGRYTFRHRFEEMFSRLQEVGIL